MKRFIPILILLCVFISSCKKQVKTEHPTADQVAENKKKWGWG